MGERVRPTSLLIVALASGLFAAALLTQVRASGVATPDAAARAADSYKPPVPSPTSPRKIDEYGDLRWGDEKARLDNAADEFKSDPSLNCYLICYGGRATREGAARRRCRRAAHYLVGRRGVEARRVFTLDGGYKEDLTVEIWPVPVGAQPPIASPTVDPSELKSAKAARRRVRGRR